MDLLSELDQELVCCPLTRHLQFTDYDQIQPEWPGNRPSVFINFHVHGDVRLGENIAICHVFISW